MFKPLTQEDLVNYNNYIFYVGDLRLEFLLKILFADAKNLKTVFVFTNLKTNYINKVIYFLLEKKHHLRQFSYQAFPIEYRAKADAEAFKDNNINYDSIILSDELPDSYLSKTYKSSEISIAFKKQLLLDIKLIKYFDLVERYIVKKKIM